MNFSRPEQVQELENKREFDLLIIGGGIVGSAALEICFQHYCVAKPSDYMLRRTHLSWFNVNGGERDLKNIIEKFEIENIEKETLKELDDEGLLDKSY
tara:strand:+ start:293 stop:586 length:294 start_codon:yes stop_codon:yes gene_type:complete